MEIPHPLYDGAERKGSFPVGGESAEHERRPMESRSGDARAASNEAE